MRGWAVRTFLFSLVWIWVMRALDLFVDSLGEVEKKFDLQEDTRMFPRVKVMEVSRVRVRGTIWT